MKKIVVLTLLCISGTNECMRRWDGHAEMRANFQAMVDASHARAMAISRQSVQDALQRGRADQQRHDAARRLEVAQQMRLDAERRAALERKNRENDERNARERQAASEALCQRLAAEQQQQYLKKQAADAQAGAERLHQAHLKEQADREVAALVYVASHPPISDPGLAGRDDRFDFVSPMRPLPGQIVEKEPWDLTPGQQGLMH